MSGRLGMTDAEFDRAMTPFAPQIERGYRATLALNRLAGDEGFRQRYLKGDAEAVALYNQLSALKAAGTQPYHDAVGTMQAAETPGTSAAALALINDADFVARYTAGDSAARAQWEAASPHNSLGYTSAVAQAAEGSDKA
ncbi:hypothetical protein [Dongia sp.]|uniref:hypothetical protein n=1 Tax=Dongia sp. TaxID=1977262 RepID=UPI0037523786